MVQGALTIVGVPTSAGAHYAGLEAAPRALREVGLLEQLRAAGADVVDGGDVVGALFATDQRHPRARNLDAAVAVARQVADATERVLTAGRVPLVLGGDCTLTIGVVAGAQRMQPDVGVLYFDGDADLTTPETTRSGILDSMVVSHLLGRADTPLAALDRPRPMLADDHLVMLGYDPDDTDSFPPGALDQHAGVGRIPRLDLPPDDFSRLRHEVAALAGRTSAAVVHFDVDAVDSSDLPLANFPHYGVGLSLDVASTVLRQLCASPRLAAIVLTEVNPSHDPTGRELRRYVDAVVRALTS